MGIRFHCPNGHKLHVKAFLAGKRGVCPHCSAKFTIPSTELGAVAPRPRLEPAGSSNLPSSEPPLGGAKVSPPASTSAIWHVRLPSGDEYGPTTQSMLGSWVAEGRVSPDSLVWREGWDEWRAMNGLFSSPASRPDAVPPVPEVPGPSPPSSAPIEVPTIVTPVAVATDTPKMVKHRRKRQVQRVVVILAILCLVLLVPLVVMLAD